MVSKHTLYYNYWEVKLFLGAMDTKVSKKKKREENMNDIPVASIICWMSTVKESRNHDLWLRNTPNHLLQFASNVTHYPLYM